MQLDCPHLSLAPTWVDEDDQRRVALVRSIDAFGLCRGGDFEEAASPEVLWLFESQRHGLDWKARDFAATVRLASPYSTGFHDEALVEIRKLLIIEPTNAEAFLLSGRINQRRGDQETAIAALKTAIFWDPPPKMIDAQILLGRIFLERGDLGEARKYAATAMSIDPNNQEAIALQRQVTMGKP